MLPAHAASTCTAQSCNADDLDGWLARRGSDNRIWVDEGPRAFERMAGPQHQRVAVEGADHLQTHRQAVFGEAAGQVGRRLTGQVERVGKRSPFRPPILPGPVRNVPADSTSIMGCCGSGVAGGVLTLAGVGTGTASEIAGWSTSVQALFIVGFVLNWLRLRGKLGVVGGR